MAEDVEKTEPPTQKRQSEARRKGQLAISTELFTVANLLAVTLTIMFMGPSVIHQSMNVFRTLWLPRTQLGLTDAVDVLRLSFGAAAQVIFPILLAAMVSGILIGLVQTKGNISFYRLRPKVSKLNPLKNLSQIVKKQAVIELPKSIVKVAIVGAVIYFAIQRHFSEYPGLSRLPPILIIAFQLQVVMEAYLAGALALIFLALGDYAFQRWRNAESLKMSKTEVKEEARQSEGDPHVKGRLRSLQYERARTRMMEAVPTADVVVTNPDHISVALAYQRSEMPAPKVVAKGAGFLAHRIREIAESAGVPIVQNPPLARSLYRSIKVGHYVPEKLYQAIAEVLAYVFRLDRTRARAW